MDETRKRVSPITPIDHIADRMATIVIGFCLVIFVVIGSVS